MRKGRRANASASGPVVHRVDISGRQNRVVPVVADIRSLRLWSAAPLRRGGALFRAHTADWKTEKEEFLGLLLRWTHDGSG